LRAAGDYVTMSRGYPYHIRQTESYMHIMYKKIMHEDSVYSLSH